MARELVMKRILTVAAICGAALAIGVLATVTTSSAAVSGITATGTLSCGAATGTLTFSPPLTSGNTSKAVLNYKPTNCTHSGGNLPSRIKIGFGRDKGSGSSPCLCIYINTWSSRQASIANSRISVKSSSFVTTPSGNEALTYQGAATGSFAGPVAVTLNSTTSSSEFQSELQNGGVPSLTFTSGSTKLGN
jgi:hypothetical protein